MKQWCAMYVFLYSIDKIPATDIERDILKIK